MAAQHSFRVNITDQVIPTSEVVKVNRQDDKLQFISLQSDQESEEDDDLIVPPN